MASSNRTKVKDRSYWVTKTRDGKQTSTHYRVYDAGDPSITPGMWILAFILAFILHTVFGVI